MERTLIGRGGTSAPRPRRRSLHILGHSEVAYPATRGTAQKANQAGIRPALEYYESLTEGFPKALGDGGNLASDSISFIVGAVHERNDQQLRSAHAPGAGHPITWPAEHITRSGLIRGEMAAIGSCLRLLSDWLTLRGPSTGWTGAWSATELGRSALVVESFSVRWKRPRNS